MGDNHVVREPRTKEFRMSLITLAAAVHIAKHSRSGYAPSPRRFAPLTAEERRERRVERVKSAAIALAITLAVAAAFVGIVFAEQVGIAWLSVLLQALLFLPLLAIVLAMLGLCLFLLAGC